MVFSRESSARISQLRTTHKACLSVSVLPKPSPCVAASVHTTALHSTPGSYPGRRAGRPWSWGGRLPGDCPASALTGAIVTRWGCHARGPGIRLGEPAAAGPILPGWGCDGASAPPGPAPSGTLVGWGPRGC